MLFRFTFLVLALSHWVSAQSNSTPVVCSNVPTFALSMRVPISDFCRVFLGINPVTTTQTTTPRITRTTTIGKLAITVLTVSTTATSTTTTTMTDHTSFTPEISTTTLTLSSTAHLGSDGETTLLERRNTRPTQTALPLGKRATATKPSVLNRYNRNDLTKICRCNTIYNVPARIPKTIAVRPTVVATTKFNTRTLVVRITSTINTQETKVARTTIVYTAPTPVETEIEVEYHIIPYGEDAEAVPRTTIDSLTDSSAPTETSAPEPHGAQCAPDYDPHFFCPEGTGDAVDRTDPTYNSNHLTCPLVTGDDFGGSCIYSIHNGSPQISTLRKGTTGNSHDDFTRSAVYGDQAGDDCAAFPDFVCPASTSTLSPSVTPTRRMK